MQTHLLCLWHSLWSHMVIPSQSAIGSCPSPVCSSTGQIARCLATRCTGMIHPAREVYIHGYLGLLGCWLNILHPMKKVQIADEQQVTGAGQPTEKSSSLFNRYSVGTSYRKYLSPAQNHHSLHFCTVWPNSLLPPPHPTPPPPIHTQTHSILSHIHNTDNHLVKKNTVEFYIYETRMFILQSGDGVILFA